MADIQAILDPLPIPKQAKAEIWDAYHGASSPEDFQARFDKLPIPKGTKAALWDAKFSRPVDPPGALSRLASSVYESTIGPAVHMVTHPKETVLNTVGSAIDAIQNPAGVLKRYGGAAAVPVPVEILEGDMASASGKALGTVASVALPELRKAGMNAAAPATRYSGPASQATLPAVPKVVKAGSHLVPGGRRAVRVYEAIRSLQEEAAEKMPGKAPQVVDIYENPPAVADPYTRKVEGRPVEPVEQRVPVGPRQPRPAEAARPELAAGDYYAAKPPASPGELLARETGAPWERLTPEDRAMLEHAAKAQQNVSSQPSASARPQPTPEPQAPAPHGKMAADLLREEIEAKRTAEASRNTVAAVPSGSAPRQVAAAKKMETSARAAKAQKLAQTLFEHGISPADAGLIETSQWKQLSKAVGVNEPSAATIGQTIEELKKLHRSAVPAAVVKKPSAAAIAEQLRDEMKRSGTIQ